MKRKVAILSTTFLAVLAVVMTVAAYPETGVLNSNQSADCGFQPGCHENDNSLTMAMQASSLSLHAGQSVSVWVNVTRNGAGGDGGDEEASPIAVILLANSTTGVGIDPVSGGWAIVSDPVGTTFNENQQYAGVGSTPYRWVLQAPSTAGNYKLLAQGFHDGPSFTTYSLGLSFSVSGAPVALSAKIASPLNGASVYGTFELTASVTGSQITSVIATLDGSTLGTALTAAPFQWSVEAAQLTAGSHTALVTATDINGNTSTDQVTFTVAHAASSGTGSQSSTPISPGIFAIVAAIAIALAVIVGWISAKGKK